MQRKEISEQIKDRFISISKNAYVYRVHLRDYLKNLHIDYEIDKITSIHNNFINNYL